MSAASLLLAWLMLASPPASPPPAVPAPTSSPSAEPAAEPAPEPVRAVTALRDVYALDEEAFVAQARRDLEALRQGIEGLRRIQVEAARSRALYRQKQSVPYTPDEKQLLVSTWAAFFDCFVATEGVRQRYWEFLKVPSLTQPRKHAWGFLLTHAALAAELAQGLRYVELAAGQAQLEVLLDEPVPQYGLPPRTFGRFKEHVLHVGTTTQLFTGDGYRGTLHPLLAKAGVLDDPGVPALLQAMRDDSRAARGSLLKRGPVMFARVVADLTQDTTARAVFPVQKTVAEWMGDTRVRRAGKPLISREQALKLLERMAPGDVVLARQNWFLSNIGLPGFWPHAELYVGTAQDLAQAFDADADVKAWVATLPGQPETFTAHLARAFPAKWAEYTGKDAHGDPVRIIESISEGVSFTGVEHGLRVDYLGVLRPRLSRLDKARAILRAFTFQGRPYDFNFDFFSDQTLVCTELVWKSYAPARDMKGLSIPLVNVAGRRTLPANEIVRLFDAEYGTPTRQFDFVAFLDGREARGDAIEANAEVFRYTYRRMKWDIAQE